MSDQAIAIIGGSGLYELDGLDDAREVQVETPYGSPSDALVVGAIAGAKVIFLARHGRGHRLLPHELPHRANVWALKSLGARWLIGVSAVGSLVEEMAPGHVVFPDQFFDRGKSAPTFFGGGVAAYVSFGEPVCAPLRDLLAASTREHGGHVHVGGTYVNIEGPHFSTRAESEYHRRQGFSVVGMTNLPEARLAREAQMAYATMCLVTDYDSWHPTSGSVTLEMALGWLAKSTGLAKQVVHAAVPRSDALASYSTTRRGRPAMPGRTLPRSGSGNVGS